MLYKVVDVGGNLLDDACTLEEAFSVAASVDYKCSVFPSNYTPVEVEVPVDEAPYYYLGSRFTWDFAFVYIIGLIVLFAILISMDGVVS